MLIQEESAKGGREKAKKQLTLEGSRKQYTGNLSLKMIKAPSTIVYTTTPKTITENGAIRKRSPEWSDLKTMLFENAVL